MNERPLPVWDLPVRVFHWSLAVLVVAAVTSVSLGAMEVHECCGLSILVLVAARIVWGFMGGTHARFTSFVRGPRAVLEYLRGPREPGEGHNPAGGWSVLAMLALLLVQAGSGLFNEDDVAFSGPLAHLVGSKLRGVIGELHEMNFLLLGALVALHVLTVLLYRRRGYDLIRPMLDGGRTHDAVRTRPAWLALLVLLGCAAALWLALAAVPKPVVFL